MAEATVPTDRYAAFRVRDFRLFAVVVLLSAVLQQTQAVALGWDMYNRTGSAMALGLIGLSQFVPAMLFFLPAGEIADRFDRRKVMIASFVLWGTASTGLAVAAIAGAGVGWLYFFAAVSTTGHVINRPARDALLPQLVPGPVFPNAVVWSSSLYQLASISGPAVAGSMIAVYGGASVVYGTNAVLILVALVLATRIPARAALPARRATTWRDLFAGLAHVWRTPVVLGVMSLDLLAVIFASATALLPLYARDILHVGPRELGWLSAAPAMGALGMAFLQGAREPRHVGRAFFISIAGYGLATAVFGMSTSFWLSLAALVGVGAMDNISVVIRQTVVQLYTPDEVRGRVSAVNRVFIQSSNQLGAFESGALAMLTTPVFAVVAGGIVTVLIAAAGIRLFPELRKLGALQRY
jgi:MFS family permease